MSLRSEIGIFTALRSKSAFLGPKIRIRIFAALRSRSAFHVLRSGFELTNENEKNAETVGSSKVNKFENRKYIAKKQTFLRILRILN